MGQTQSRDTDNLSAQDAVTTIDILQKLKEDGGPTAVNQYINENLNRWKREQVKFAITGRGATGKSTFINTIRNVKPADDDFAKAGSGDTTVEPKCYTFPKNDQITFCDLPGYASTKFKKEEYISEMKIHDYDFVLIFVNNALSEDEVWMVGELRKLDKPFAFVRSKIDLDLDNAIYDGKDKEKIIPEIKLQLKEELDTALNDTNCTFLISSRKPDLGEMSDLMRYIDETIDGFKAQVLLLFIHPMTKDILERKYKMLKERIVAVTALAAGVAAMPVPGVDVTCNAALLVHEVRHYMNVFGVEPEKVNSLKYVNHSLLKCRSLFKPQFDMLPFIMTKLGTYATLIMAQSLLDLVLPIFGSVVSAATAAWATYTFLGNMLEDIRHDAVLIQEHVMKQTIGDHRM